MDKKKTFKEKHNECVDDFLNEFVNFFKWNWEVWKKPKFWAFYFISMTTIAVCYYLGVFTR